MTGKFLVFEGINGSGKTTVIKRVADELRAARHTVLVTKEPTDEPIGKLIQEYYKKSSSMSYDWLTEAFLYMADRNEHNIQIEEALKKFDYVISDRYYLSTVAYQGARGNKFMLYTQNMRLFLEPDITFILLCDVGVAKKRIIVGSIFDEELEYQEKVADIYRWCSRMFHQNPLVLIDGNFTLGAIHDKIMNELFKRSLI